VVRVGFDPTDRFDFRKPSTRTSSPAGTRYANRKEEAEILQKQDALGRLWT
jgi:hypothetical protein